MQAGAVLPRTNRQRRATSPDSQNQTLVSLRSAAGNPKLLGVACLAVVSLLLSAGWLLPPRQAQRPPGWTHRDGQERDAVRPSQDQGGLLAPEGTDQASSLDGEGLSIYFVRSLRDNASSGSGAGAVDTSAIAALWRSAGYREVTDIGEADIVYAAQVDAHDSEALEQMVKPHQHVIGDTSHHAKDGIDVLQPLQLGKSLHSVVKNTIRAGSHWVSTFGARSVTLDFEPVNPMPPTYVLSDHLSRLRFWSETAMVAGAMVNCSLPISKLGSTERWKKYALLAGATDLVLRHRGQLRAVRCDLELLDELERGKQVNRSRWKLLPGPPREEQEWVVQEAPWSTSVKLLVNDTGSDSAQPATSQHADFRIRALVVVASARRALAFFHDGFALVSSGDTSEPVSSMTGHLSERQEEQLLDWEAVGEALQRWFPVHRNPVAHCRCAMERAAAIFLAASGETGVLDVGGVADRSRSFALDFAISISGDVQLVGAKPLPTLAGEIAGATDVELSVAQILSKLSSIDQDASLSSLWPIESARALRPIMIDGTTLHDVTLPSCSAPHALESFGAAEEPGFQPPPDVLPRPLGYVLSNRAAGTVAAMKAHYPVCEGSREALALGERGVRARGCPFDDGRCIYFAFKLPGPHPETHSYLQFWMEAGYHLVINMCDADIVYPIMRQAPQTEVIERRLRPMQRVLGFNSYHSRHHREFDIQNKDTLNRAFVRMLDNVQRLPPTVDNPRETWKAEFGTTLDFAPYNPMPLTFLLGDTPSRTAFRKHVEPIVQPSVNCSLSIEQLGTEKLERPMILKNGQGFASLGNVIIDKVGELRAIICDLARIDSELEGMRRLAAGGEHRTRRLSASGTPPPWKLLTPKRGPLDKWTAQYLVDTVLLPLELPGEGGNGTRTEYRTFYSRTFVIAASVSQPLAFFHDGYVRVASIDGRKKDRSDKKATLPNAVHTPNTVNTASSEVLLQALRKWYPNHPNPVAHWRCQMERASALMLAAGKGTGAMLLDGAVDRARVWGLDFIISTEGEIVFLEANWWPGLMMTSLPHTITTSKEWLYEMTRTVMEVEDRRRNGTTSLWPLKSPRTNRLILLDDSTEHPDAIESCSLPGALEPFGRAVEAWKDSSQS